MKRTLSGPGTEVSAAEAERVLLRKLEAEKESPHKVLRALADLCLMTRQRDKALGYLHQIIALAPDAEEKAHCLLNMGQLMEQTDDFPAAVRYYSEAVALEPTEKWVSYFIHNNLGFSLNTLGDCVFGEFYCRKAIEIDPDRPNGHKNLGIALAGQGEYREAAQSFIDAAQEDALDDRAFNLLTTLLEDHPELDDEFGAVARLCGEAIQTAKARHTH